MKSRLQRLEFFEGVGILGVLGRQKRGGVAGMVVDLKGLLVVYPQQEKVM